MNSSFSTAMNFAPSDSTCSLVAGRTSVAVTMRADAARRGDRLQAGDADAHDEHLRGGHRARGRHHHRHGAAIFGGGVDDGAIAGDIGLEESTSITCARVMRGMSSMAKA